MSRENTAICLLLTALVFIVYGQTTHFDFVNYDDHLYVYDNPEIIKGLSAYGVGWAFTHIHGANWHPLTTITHMFDCQVYGLWPGGHHLDNVLLHTAAAVLLFLMLREMTGALWRSALVAAVFAVHPLRVESVAWVSERKDVLSGVFFMLTLWAYARYARNPPLRGRYAMVGFWFALGLLGKPMLVTVPFVLLLLDYWPLNRLQHTSQLSGLLREKLPLLALSALSCVATVLAQKEAIQPLEHFSLPLRTGNAMVAYVVYLGKLFYPANLAALYPIVKNGLPGWQIAGATLLLAALTAGFWLLRGKLPYLLVGWLWYLGMLVPVIGILQVGVQAYADRYTYLPQIGLCIAGTWAVADWIGERRRLRLLFDGIAVVALCALTVASIRQAAFWRNSISLWSHALECTTGNSLAHSSYGLELQRQGRFDEAIAQYRDALVINPTSKSACLGLAIALSQKGRPEEAAAMYRKYLRIVPDNEEALDNLGYALFQMGRTDDAIQCYLSALKIKPGYAKAHGNLGVALIKQSHADAAIAEFRESLRINPKDADASENLGNALLDQGHTQEAISQYRETLRIDPASAKACYDLGVALQKLGQTQEAVTKYRDALRINPAYTDARLNLGIFLMQQGRAEEGIAEFRSAVQHDPASIAAHINLGKALLQQKQTEDAVAEFREVARLSPADAGAEVNLAGVLMRLGHVEEAIAHMRKALDLQPANANLQNNLAWVLATAPQPSLRDGARAVQLATQASQATGGNNSLVLRTLAAAYAEAGKFPDAVQTAQNALQLAGAQSNTAVADALRRELKLYEAGRKYEDAR